MIALVASYFWWHYTIAFRELGVHAKNFLWFFFHLFSIPVLLKTFFQPWKRMAERYPKGLDIGGFLSTLLINVLMRIVGALMRTIVLAVGVVVVVVIFCLSVASFFVWAILPWLAILVFLSGVRLLFI